MSNLLLLQENKSSRSASSDYEDADEDEDDELSHCVHGLCHQIQESMSLIREEALLLRQASALVTSLEDHESSGMQVLYDLEARIAKLEGKLLPQVQEAMMQEVKHIEALKQLYHEANQQHERLQELFLHVGCNEQKENQTTSNNSDDATKTMKSPTLPSRTLPLPSLIDSKLPPSSSTISSSSASIDHYASRLETMQLTRVTQQELDQIPRTIRGRISLAVINEALDDLQVFWHHKVATALREEQRKRQQQLPYSSTSTSTSASPLHISEQQLRQSCAFFRTGESTARSVLLILRALHRLQQIPTKKKGDAVYVLPEAL